PELYRMMIMDDSYPTVELTLGAGTYASGNVQVEGSAEVTVNHEGAHWAGLVLDGSTEHVGSGTQDDIAYSDDVAGESNSTIVFNNSTFGQSVASGANSNVSFNGTTTIEGQAMGQSGS